MSLSVDGAWKAGVWAESVWADEIWREGEAPEQPVEAAPEVQPTGGWLFLNLYEAELQRRRAREQKQRELAESVDEIQDALDRDIALLLHEKDAIEAKRVDLERLGELAKVEADIQAAKQYSERVAVAYQRAIEKGTYSALEALDRELTRAKEEEEFLVLSVLLLDS